MAINWCFRPFIVIVLVCFSGSSFAQATSTESEVVVAVLGTGDMGDSFGPRLAENGYRVIYGSRTPDGERVRTLVARTGYKATATTSDLAAREADVVILALPWGPMEQVIKSLGGMEGKTIIDLTWPEYEIGDDGYFHMNVETSGAEMIQEWLPKAMVVKAFGTTGTNVIDDPNDAGGLVSIPIASDHRQAKELTAKIAYDLGLDPIDAGPLRMARNIEAMMALYMVPIVQGREEGWEFYFRRTNYWMCNQYTGEENIDGNVSDEDLADLAQMPKTHPDPEPCTK